MVECEPSMYCAWVDCYFLCSWLQCSKIIKPKKLLSELSVKSENTFLMRVELV